MDTLLEDNSTPHRTMKATPARRSKTRGSPLSPAERLAYVQEIDNRLRELLDRAKTADAPQLAGRLRAAIKSAGGAVRNAEGRLFR